MHLCIQFSKPNFKTKYCSIEQKQNRLVEKRNPKREITLREITNRSLLPNGAIDIRFSNSVTCLLSPSCWSLKASGDPSIQLLGAIPGLTCSTIFSICIHTFSGALGGASVPLGSVHSIAYFSIAPVGRARDCIQIVAVRLTGGGFNFPGTLKSTMAVHNTGFIVAFTVHLCEAYDVNN